MKYWRKKRISEARDISAPVAQSRFAWASRLLPHGLGNHHNMMAPAQADPLEQKFFRGEPEAFNAVYEQFSKPIRKFVARKIRDEETVDELVQEIFLKVHRFRETYRPEHPLSSWIWTIARNTVHDSLRSTLTKPEFSGDPEQVACPNPCPEKRLEKKSERRSFLLLLGKLSRHQRKVMRLRLIEQLSYQEIAARLGLSLSAVKCLVYRSKQALSLSHESGKNLATPA